MKQQIEVKASTAPKAAKEIFNTFKEGDYIRYTYSDIEWDVWLKPTMLEDIYTIKNIVFFKRTVINNSNVRDCDVQYTYTMININKYIFNQIQKLKKFEAELDKLKP